MSRVFLAAEAGAPIDPLAQRGRDAAATVAWADPALRSHEGRSSLSVLQTAAASVATSVKAPGAAVCFLPGLDAALRFAAQYTGTGPLICSAVERKAVLAAAVQRNGRGGPQPCAVDDVGRVALDCVADLVSANVPCAVATQVGNPEVGTLQPVPELHEICRDAGVPLLLDASMAAGRTPLPTAWDVLVLDARSWAGGNDVAIVVVKPGAAFAASAFAGVVAELPLGAPDVPDCAAAALTLEARVRDAAIDAADTSSRTLTARLRAGISQLLEVDLHGDAKLRLPHIVAFSALYVDAEALLLQLDRLGIAVASGSACAVDSGEPSHVLAAMGRLTSGNVRATLPLGASAEDVEALLGALPEALADVRREAGL